MELEKWARASRRGAVFEEELARRMIIARGWAVVEIRAGGGARGLRTDRCTVHYTTTSTTTTNFTSKHYGSIKGWPFVFCFHLSSSTLK